ncbi:MAG TPA: ATP-dependent DNA helicase RecQ [Micromonosporaceae bacterium]|nr:ATP-dependent DNA helicase RecQ [Micromonosporaceae bacterium]
MHSWRLRRAARRHFGWRTLRVGQLEAMRALLSGRDAMVILPTGAGKSAVYQVPATLVRGPTLVISPLLALQHDQIAGLHERGVAELRAVRVSSSETPKQQAAALDEIRSGQARLLFITPEQLGSPARLVEIKALRPALIAIDEAHCISTWGHDFRPDYLALGHIIRELGHPPVVALTATASPPLREDIATRLGLRKPVVVIGGLDRPNLFLEAMHCPTEDHRWRRLLMLLDRRDGSGIVYVPTRRAAENLAKRLTAAGYPATHYHGGLGAGVRKARHERFDSDATPIMVATSAFGMGIDKPNIRFVVHMALPDSPDSYLQEIGRAGRDGAPARVLLLFRPEDIALQRFFTGGVPAVDDLIYLAAGVRAGVRTKADLAESTGMSTRKVAALIGLLEAIGAATTARRGELHLPPYAPEPPEAARLAVMEAERHQTLQRSRTDMMRALAETSGCRVQPLLAYFGEQMSRACGHCDNCVRSRDGEGGLESGSRARGRVIGSRGAGGRSAVERRPGPGSGSGTAQGSATAQGPGKARGSGTARGAGGRIPAARGAGQADGAVPYPLHSTVSHRQWGRGTVLGYDQDRMTVLFEEVGYKTLSVALVRANGLLAADGDRPVG